MSHSPYRYVNGYRLVVPYIWYPTRRVPPHWVNETLQDLYSETSLYKGHQLFDTIGTSESVLYTEYIASDRRYFKISLKYVQNEIESGRVLVSKQKATPTQRLKPNDTVQYSYHRHEPEVLDYPVRVLQVTREVVIIDKPPSIPVHPVGEYMKNTIIEIVKHEHPNLLQRDDWEDNEERILANTHRLDRTVSGLLILARTKSVAQKFAEAFRKRRIKKWYLAKVKGVFPSGRVEVDKPIMKISSSPVLFTVKSGEESKQAKTIFKRLSLTPNGCSIILCEPQTGVSHQLRTHLQWLGYPILGDIKYGGGERENENYYKSAPSVLRDHTHYEWCLDCQRGRRDISRISKQDLLLSSICLHALHYESSDPKWAWHYTAPPPKWLTDMSVYDKLINDNNNNNKGN